MVETAHLRPAVVHPSGHPPDQRFGAVERKITELALGPGLLGCYFKSTSRGCACSSEVLLVISGVLITLPYT